VTLKAITMSIERRDFTVIFPFFPKIYRDFGNFYVISCNPTNYTINLLTAVTLRADHTTEAKRLW